MLKFDLLCISQDEKVPMFHYFWKKKMPLPAVQDSSTILLSLIILIHWLNKKQLDLDGIYRRSLCSNLTLNISGYNYSLSISNLCSIESTAMWTLSIISLIFTWSVFDSFLIEIIENKFTSMTLSNKIISFI